MPEPVTAQALAPLLEGTLFAAPKTIHIFTTLGSTNAEAIQAAAKGADEGTIFLAEEQTAGRGRSGHAWHSEPGTGIYLSVVLRPKLASSDVLWLSLITGLAVHRAVEQVVGIVPDLRWPNDIMLGTKKMGGILTEISAEAHHVRFAVVGIGLNVNQVSFPAELRAVATSLREETGREWPRLELVAALLQSLDAEYRALEQGVHSGVQQEILRRFERCSSYVRGARVQVDDHGAGAFEGVTAGLDARGFLLVRTAQGPRTVVSGGVRKI